MDPKLFPEFVDEAMRLVPAVRDCLLLVSKNGVVPDDLPATQNTLSAISDSARLLGLSEIHDLSAAIDGEMKLIAVNRMSPMAITSALDLLSKLEAALLKTSLDEENFSLDIDDLIDESFGKIHEVTSVTDPAPFFQIDEPIANDFAWPEAEPIQEFEQTDEFEVDAELLEIFAEEAEGLLKNIESSLDLLAADPNHRDALWEIRRNAHTFKGSAGIVGSKQLSELAHRVEDLLDRISETNAVSNARIFDLLHTSTNCLRSLTNGENSPSLFGSISQLYYDFDGVLASLHESTPDHISDRASIPLITEPIDTIEPSVELAYLEKTERPAEKVFAVVSREHPVPAKAPNSKAVVRVSLDRLDELVRIVRDMFISRSVFEQNLKTLDRQIDDLHNTTRRLQSTSTRLEIDFEASMMGSGSPFRNHGTGPAPLALRDGFDELEFDQYTEFHQSTRELAETANDAFSINASLDQLRGGFESLFDEQQRLVEDLQEKLMRIRMVDFGSLSSRLQRAVRVTCEEENKKAQIRIENERLEVDTQILDSLIEPLMHLLKNAVVHGIEDSETRAQLGKPAVGVIKVSLSNEETHIVLAVSDDGRGISPTAIKEKAVSMGLLAAQDAAAMHDEEALELIFLPGLTTAEKLNLSAGRGVGMSIVKESIAAARGTISIDSTYQKGTTFTVRMPLTFAITNVLLVKSSSRTYAVPLKQITYITELTDDLFVGIDGQKVDLMGKKLPLHQLSAFLGYQPVSAAGLLGKTALLYESSDRSCAIAVEAVVRSEEVVIKPLLKPLDKIDGILGAAILGSGEIVPIVDLPALLKKKVQRQKQSPPPEIEADPKTISVLVVDDSPSVRHLTSKVIQAAGWHAKTAKDGLDALEQLKNSNDLPAVILSDIEMPRMDGYEFAASLQRSEEFRSIPVIMITSRTAEKHRDKALEIGVSQYITKPYEDRELIDSIKALASLT